jgi:hypothetical protein
MSESTSLNHFETLSKMEKDNYYFFKFLVLKIMVPMWEAHVHMYVYIYIYIYSWIHLESDGDTIADTGIVTVNQDCGCSIEHSDGANPLTHSQNAMWPLTHSLCFSFSLLQGVVRLHFNNASWTGPIYGKFDNSLFLFYKTVFTKPLNVYNKVKIGHESMHIINMKSCYKYIHRKRTIKYISTC